MSIIKRQGVIIDEAQNYPDLFSYLQVISDANPERRYIITGNTSTSFRFTFPNPGKR